jgi:hypothetical protein
MQALLLLLLLLAYDIVQRVTVLPVCTSQQRFVTMKKV